MLAVERMDFEEEEEEEEEAASTTPNDMLSIMQQR